MSSNSPSKTFYCTYFDQHYLTRGLAMIESLRNVGDESDLIVLALDDFVFTHFEINSYKGVKVIGLKEIEASYPELTTLKESRNRIEYIFTITPWLIKYVLETSSQDDWVTYLDADLFFFSSPSRIYDFLNEKSVGIVPHRFNRLQSWRIKFGKYNVGWVSFRNNSDGKHVLNWWADSCLEWCEDVPHKGKFADQGYLNGFEQLSENLAVIDDLGVNLAPWNLSTSGKISRSDSGVKVSDSELIFYHFHGLRIVGDRYYFKHIPYFARTTKSIRDGIYRPYCESLHSLGRKLDASLLTENLISPRKTNLFPTWKSKRTALFRLLGYIRGDYLDV